LLARWWGRLRWHTSRPGVNKLVSDVRLTIKYRGNAVQCPFCGWQGSLFYPHPPPHERPNSLCPRCWSKERHRLLYLYLIRTIDILSLPGRTLEIAPGPYSYYLFRDRAGKSYFTLDYESSLAAIKGDICSLPFMDRSFDIVICYHVLEHIPDDARAMRELGRVLNPEGQLLIQVPIEGDATREDLSVTDEAERIRLFGQADHVRSYGRDIANRLRSTGLDVEETDFASTLSPEEIQRFGLRSGELTYLCHYDKESA
jgi:SAM-dependent methyltransferase